MTWSQTKWLIQNNVVNFFQIFSQVTGILSWIVRSWTDVENNIVSVERVNEYADTAKEVSNAKHGKNMKTLKLLLNMLHTEHVSFRPAGQSRVVLYRLIGPKKELCSSMTTGCSTVKALSWRWKESPWTSMKEKRWVWPKISLFFLLLAMNSHQFFWVRLELWVGLERESLHSPWGSSESWRQQKERSSLTELTWLTSDCMTSDHA